MVVAFVDCEIDAGLDRAETDQTVVVITGRAQRFCGGFDLAVFKRVGLGRTRLRSSPVGTSAQNELPERCQGSIPLFASTKLEAGTSAPYSYLSHVPGTPLAVGWHGTALPLSKSCGGKLVRVPTSE
jgi:hypothetical protein